MNGCNDSDNLKNCIVCNMKASNVCSNCKSVAYCSKEHQKSHWKDHKSSCMPFEIKKNDDIGRHLLATRDIPGNAKIMSEFPLVFGPKLVGPEPQCLGCYSPLDPNNGTYICCPGCRWPACSPLCMGLKDQNHHLPECVVLGKNPELALEGNFNYEAITPLRCLLLQKRNKRKWLELMAMQSHIDERGEGTEIYAELDERVVQYLIENFIKKLEPGDLPASSDMIHRLCGILEVNGLEVTAGRNDILAVYPTACLMEHSCLPNTKHTFQNIDFKMNLFASVDIQSGEHISTMYTHALWGTAGRREHLKETKYFRCRCLRCSDPTELDTHFSSLRCIGAQGDVAAACGGWILPVAPCEDDTLWKCERCPVSLSSEDVNDLISRLGYQVDLAMEDPDVVKLEKLLKSLETLVHKQHFHCYTVKHSLIQLYGRQEGFKHHELSEERLSSKIEMCNELIRVTKTLDPGNARLPLYLTVVLFELHSALVESSKRNNDPAKKRSLLSQAAQHLKENIGVLGAEQRYTAGSDLLTVSNTALINVHNMLDTQSKLIVEVD